MKENDLISIIIPVYNGEKWLVKAVNSALSQTYRNLEIIIVDDGSKDSSLSICRKFLSDSRVQLFSKLNGGQSSARNYGLQKAKGDYILFLDCDDTLESVACEKAINVMQCDFDFVLFGFNIYSNGVLLRTPHPEDIIYTGKYEDFKRFSWLLDSPCNKLYNRKFISSLFSENCVYGEDSLFNYSLLNQYTKGICIHDCLYNVNLDNPNSVNKRYKSGRLRDTVFSLDCKLNKIELIFGLNNAKRDFWADALTSLAFTIVLSASRSSFVDFCQEMRSSIYTKEGFNLLKKAASVGNKLSFRSRVVFLLSNLHLLIIIYVVSKVFRR